MLGNFLEDQDVPRWASLSVDPQTMWNAMTFSFMSDGCVFSSPVLVGINDFNFIRSIPIVYYGQEQGFNGNADPVSITDTLCPSSTVT